MPAVLLLGLGQQGRAALHDLVGQDTFEKIFVADASEAALQQAAARYPDPRLSFHKLDLRAENALAPIFERSEPGVLVDLLPIQFIPIAAARAVAAGWHYVNTYYTLPELEELAETAETANIAILPECGFDPGIDLVMAGHGFRQFQQVEEYLSYGAGVPEPEACTNPLNYKITWIFEGVLNSYYRPARLVDQGRIVEIPPDEIFAPKFRHTVDIPGVGALEAFPNGDVVKYLPPGSLGNFRRAGRFAMRWPGHGAFWHVLAKLGLLEDRRVEIQGASLSQRTVLAALLEPKLQYDAGERDLAILRVEVAGRRNGRRIRWISELVDRRDLDTGLMAMNRTVGFTAAIGAEMLAKGDISRRGLLNPWNDIPFEPFIRRLAARNIEVRSRFQIE